MTGIGLIVCSGNELKNKQKNFFRQLLHLCIWILNFVIRSLNPVKNYKDIHGVELNDDVKLYVIKLSFQIEELINSDTQRINRIKRLLKKISIQNSIQYFILPSRLSANFEDDTVVKNRLYGQCLYRALMIKILKDVYSKSNIDISSLDIAIVQGENIEELYSIISILLPFVKFLTVLTTEKEKVEKRIKELSAETGLIIRVTNNYRNGLKDARCIINLGGLKEFAINSCVSPKALIVNYGQLNFGKILKENSVINGVEIDLPEIVSKSILNTTQEPYDKSKLAEFLITCRIFETLEMDKVLSNPELLQKISELFENSIYNIKGYIGRFGPIASENFKI